MDVPSGSRVHVKGLVNLGNTCFFNSTIQCLSSLQCVLQHFRSPGIPGAHATREGPLTAALRATLIMLTADNSDKVIDPADLFETVATAAPRFKGHRQQDAQELLRYLLDAVQEEEKRTHKVSVVDDVHTSTSTAEECVLSQVVASDVECDDLVAAVSPAFGDIISSDIESVESSDEDDNRSAGPDDSSCASDAVTTLFGGKLLSCVVCKTCGNHSCVIEPFLDVSVPIPGTAYSQPVKSWGASKKGHSNIMSPSAYASSKRKKGKKRKHVSDEKLQRAEKKMVQLQHEQLKADALAADVKRATLIASSPDGLCPLVTEEWLLASSKSALIEWMQKYGKPSMLSKLKISKCLAANKQHHKAADKKQISVCIRAMQKEREAQLMLRNCMEKIAPSDVMIARSTTSSTAKDDLLVPASENIEASHPTSTSNVAGYPSQMAAPSDHKTVAMPAENALLTAVSAVPSEMAAEQSATIVSVVPAVSLEMVTEQVPTLVEVLQKGGQLAAYGWPEAKVLSPDVDKTLMNCLHNFCKVDALSREVGNGYTCSACRYTPENLASVGDDADPPLVFTDAVSRMVFHADNLPLILTVHLKRFAATSYNTMIKVPGHVAFPEVFDIAPFCATTTATCAAPRSTVYRLAGVVVHSGTIGGGHYIAHVRYGVLQPFYSDDVKYEPPCGADWAYVSDSHAESSTLESTLAAEAYLLFYENIIPTPDDKMHRVDE
jgi:ubiquitin C-terminal hydrolase